MSNPWRPDRLGGRREVHTLAVDEDHGLAAEGGSTRVTGPRKKWIKNNNKNIDLMGFLWISMGFLWILMGFLLDFSLFASLRIAKYIFGRDKQLFMDPFFRC